jgi:hypothetical protein
MGRVPAERATDYRVLRTFTDPAADPADPLARIDDVQQRFGSYADLIAEQRFRFKDLRVQRKVAPLPAGH